MARRKLPPVSSSEKITWRGTIASVQPRIRLMRSFDQRSHSYLGYVVRLTGLVDLEERSFTIAIGESVQSKYLLKIGDEISGVAAPVADPSGEIAEYYKVAKVVVHARSTVEGSDPPYHDIAPPMDEYRARGHRRLDARTYGKACTSCMYGCLMPVAIIIDQWNPKRARHRQESFCYGPLSCRLYKAGPTRKVPGRSGMTWIEEDWVDEESVAHRSPDE